MITSSISQNQPLPLQNMTLKVIEEHPNYYIVKADWQKYYLAKTYYHKSMKQIIKAQLDDLIKITAITAPLKAINNFYDFNFKTFLNAINVNQQLLVKANKVEIIKQHSVRRIVFDYVNTFPPEIQNWTKLLLFQQQTTTNNKNFTIFKQWGILPIMVVSGLHINFWYFWLNKILFFIKNKWARTILVFLLLLFYLYLLNWSIPALRAFLFLFFQFLIKQKKDQAIHPISILCFTAYCCLLLWPLAFYQLGWQLSFGISFMILFMMFKFKHYHAWIRSLLLAFILYLLTIPIQWQMNHGFSLLTIPYTLLFSPLIMFYDIVLFFNLVLNPLTHFIVLPLLNVLITIVQIVDLINIWIPTFQPRTWFLQLYFVILIITFICWRHFTWKLWTVIAINCSLISTLWLSSIVKPFYELTMINVGNAMSILITSPYHHSAILIDAGTQDLNPDNPMIYHYLTANGIYHLNAVFLTHHDLDHTSNLAYLKSHLQVDKVYKNVNQQLNYFVPSFSSIHNLSYSINSSYLSENNKSLVLLLPIFNYKFLITGDIEAQTEQLLISSRQLSKINILQVAHHGSKTSSTLEFLKIVKPEIALIAGHYQKARQFPNQETLKKLAKINAKVYYSGKNKTIVMRIYEQHYDIITLT